ncbi:hypothetical protein EAO76_14215 [Streptomyces sp. sk2.1]|nr:hypothetical protein EAO76_14215 [Streptomyces sp. sk2.1]
MLGSCGEAEDAVQDAWLRLARTEADTVHNLGGRLTTTVSRICLGVLRARTSRREDLTGHPMPDEGLDPAAGGRPRRRCPRAGRRPGPWRRSRAAPRPRHRSGPRRSPGCAPRERPGRRRPGR